jgi:hypothetical protein
LRLSFLSSLVDNDRLALGLWITVISFANYIFFFGDETLPEFINNFIYNNQGKKHKAYKESKNQTVIFTYLIIVVNNHTQFLFTLG